MSQPLTFYLQQLTRELATGQAGEHSYRPALKQLLETLEPGITAVNEPARIQCGAPDFILLRGETPVGYIEAKDAGLPLDPVERGAQLKRYRESLHNLLLTDYLEFRWYVEGQLVESASLGKLESGNKIKRLPAGQTAVASLLARFFTHTVAGIARAEELARRMAHLARLMGDAILATYKLEGDGGPFHVQLREFQDALIPQLDVGAFADMYAQTLTYGLFAARVETPPNARFDRFSANRYLPQTNPFLRNFFWNIAGPNLPDTVAWLVDDLAYLLDRADMAEILRDFGKRTRQEDPIIHFYETFLREYDPALRQQRGVYYTPEPVVGFIVRAIDQLLQSHFQRPLGLADKDTLILDPATGTATFLYFVIQQIYEKLQAMGQAGTWDEYVGQRLLPRLFGFELLMAPYAMAHLKLGMQLKAYGYTFHSQERLQIYLTNALDPAVKDAPPLGFAGMISAEGKAAARVKRDEPIMVVLGNPPYSGHSANTGEWITNLVKDYYFVDGQPLQERNTKWLLDDYVKFIRWGQQRLNQTKEGILALITNNGFLDNPTFRGMRQNIIEFFDEVYIVNLHGNSKKKEVSPDGLPDVNVFDIQQGVVISLFIKRKNRATTKKIMYSDLWGSRSDKYLFLANNDFTAMNWEELRPATPYYLLVPYDSSLREEYEANATVTDILPLNGWGIATRKDYLLVDFSKDALISRFNNIRTLPLQEAIDKYEIKASKYWDITNAIKSMSDDIAQSIKEVLFRPFDIRYIYYERFMIERGDHRYDLMQHMFSDNLALITIRRAETGGNYQHFLCTNRISVLHSTSSKEGNFVFPLYKYTTPASTAGTLFQTWETTREPNLSPAFIQTVSDTLGLTFTFDPTPQPIAPPSPETANIFTPEDVFYYAYALFHSPTYRQRYAEFLKIDFPRLPLTADRALFRQLAGLGHQLVSLHLLQAPLLDQLITRFPIPGDNEVSRPRYVEPAPVAGETAGSGAVSAGRVYINNSQYFEGIEPHLWQFQIGGYQVLDKWLKDRKGRRLTFDDVLHYQRIVIALAETGKLMARIDAAIPGWPLA